MNIKAQSRLASVLLIAVGVWVMLIPAFTSVSGNALTSLLISGGIFALAGLVQFFWENAIPSWIEAVTAVWLFVSAVSFDVTNVVGWNLVVAAIVAFMLAVWDGTEATELKRAHHRT